LAPRIFFKLILALILVLGIALFAVDFFSAQAIEASYIAEVRQSLSEKGQLLAHTPERDLIRDCVSLAHAADSRLTLVAPGGTVLADSQADPKEMENHANRAELVTAWHGGIGSTIRRSASVGVELLYVAVPAGRNAIRLSTPLAGIRARVRTIRLRIVGAVALAFLPFLGLAAFFSRYYSRRLGAIIEYAGKLADGNFRARLASGARGGELRVLSEKLNETGEKLEKTFQELQREQSEMEKLERIRKDFVINVSHELRTPLASIQGYTDTLLDGAIHDPEHNVRFLGIIKQNAERLGRLTADLLTLSRIELKTQKFQFAGYYINVLLRQNAESMQPLADKKQVTIVMEPASAETEVFCDSEAVHQILSNLMDNALKYTPAGGKIYLGAHELEGSKPEKVEIYVRDTGIGIPEQELPRLFERFYRVDKARSRELGGTGLGLAIVKHLARAQGGEVRVESVLNQGSTFIFTLPVHDLGLLESGAVQPELTAP
jgi:two-component system phosphate regulon sensor histidine kinase PhoR